MKISIGLGASSMFKLNNQVKAKYSYPNGTGTSSFSNRFNITDRTDSFLFCPGLQSSLVLKLKNEKSVSFSLRYSISMNEPLPSGKSSPPEFIDFGYGIQESRLQTVSMQIGYIF